MLNIDFSFNELAKITKANKILNIGEGKNIISNITIDSRKANEPNNNIFIALKSNRNDGHNFIKDLYEIGYRHFIISNYTENLPKANYLIVDDTLKALQQIGKKHKQKYKLKTIAITGSNGKTIVKEWLFQLLSEDFNIIRSPKSYNSQIGVPLSVMQINKSFNLGIFEAGISMPNEMDNLAEIINADIGLFLNIGTAHAENFANINQKIKEKLQLFKSVKTLIFCRDYGEITENIFQHQLFRSKNLIYWSRTNKDAHLYIEKIQSSANKSVVNCIYNNEKFSLKIPFGDYASIENAINSSLLMLHLNYDIDIINKRLSKLSQVAMRLELKKGINNCSIINDSYNSDINSLSIALDFLKQQKQSDKYTLILSDILQTGKSDYSLYESIGKILKEKGITKIIGIGKAISSNADKFDLEKSFFKSTDDFLNYYPFSEFSNENILLKGARKFQFEKISRFLEERIHETIMEVNLTALTDNYNYFKSIIGPKTKIMAMVKAFSYGSGSFELANILQYHNVDYLAVAYADEGVELRKAGIKTPIMVMNPQLDSFDLMAQYKLEPEIFSPRILNEFVSYFRNSTYSNREFGIHLKIETGMKRLGFEFFQIDDLLKVIKANPQIKVKSVFSHLAASDDIEKKDFSLKQINEFKEISEKIESKFNYKVIKHIANSAAITNFPESHFDMVRLGISLYGFSANEEIEKSLRNVSSLKTVISQIKKIKMGESIGYNRSFIADKEMKIAIIPIGYADGLNRLLSNRKSAVLINNNKAEIIGNICMDMTMIDIDGINVQEGDDVIVFNNQKMVKEIANTLGTIEYEVLTSIGRRVKRIYYQE